MPRRERFLKKTPFLWVSISFQRGWPRRYVGGSLVLKLVLRKGAGYIGGRTLFFAYNGVDARGWPKGSVHRSKRFQAGLTRNANRVPYPKAMSGSDWRTFQYKLI